MNVMSALRERWFTAGPEVNDLRWVVVDVESSGLHATRDRLIAIAGVAVHLDATARQGGDPARGSAPRIALGDSFEVVLRQPTGAVDKHNILLHGIGVGAQREGCEPVAALEAFERWVASSPLIAFHAAFDETMIGRAMDKLLGRRLSNPWLDLEPVAGVARPDVAARSLDEWMEHFGIRCMVRHQAACDTLATAELLLELWPALRRQVRGEPTFRALLTLAAQRKWLPR